MWAGSEIFYRPRGNLDSEGQRKKGKCRRILRISCTGFIVQTNQQRSPGEEALRPGFIGHFGQISLSFVLLRKFRIIIYHFYLLLEPKSEISNVLSFFKCVYFGSVETELRTRSKKKTFVRCLTLVRLTHSCCQDFTSLRQKSCQLWLWMLIFSLPCHNYFKSIRRKQGSGGRYQQSRPDVPAGPEQQSWSTKATFNQI